MRGNWASNLAVATLAACCTTRALSAEATVAARDKQEDKAMSIHPVSVIDTKDFGPGALRVGDLNGDGAPDLLVVQGIYDTREITCLTAVTIDGKVLWQTGKPSAKNARGPYSDLPVQVYDWDNDGVNEVLYVRQAKYVGAPPGIRERADRYEGDATMIVLNALTGKEKKTFAIPAPADDSFLFADLTGRGRRQDLVVKDRYWNMWGVSFEGKVLWHWKGSVGHYPAVADVDNDGKDEVFVGYALIDHDGKVLFDNYKGSPPGTHSDANWILRLPDGTWRLAFGNSGAHLLTPEGKELWRASIPEAQHVVAGRFRGGALPQIAVVERGQQRTAAGVGVLDLFDLDGKKLWSKTLPPGSWGVAIEEIDWSGAGQPREIFVYGLRSAKEYAAIYDGAGNVVDTFPIPFKVPEPKVSGKEVCYALRADVWGDSREEVILYGPTGIAILANARPLAVPTLYNETVYTGM